MVLFPYTMLQCNYGQCFLFQNQPLCKRASPPKKRKRKKVVNLAKDRIHTPAYPHSPPHTPNTPMTMVMVINMTFSMAMKEEMEMAITIQLQWKW